MSLQEYDRASQRRSHGCSEKNGAKNMQKWTIIAIIDPTEKNRMSGGLAGFSPREYTEWVPRNGAETESATSQPPASSKDM